MKGILLRSTLVMLVCLMANAEDAARTLARILLDKGVLTQAEFNSFASALDGDRVDVLATILRDKGVLTSTDIAKIRDNFGEPGQYTTSSLIPVAATPSAPSQGPAAQAPGERLAAPPPITTASKYGAIFYGTLLLNASFDTSLTNNEDVPLFGGKQGSDPFGNDKSFSMTARQSRFGLRLQGPQIMGANVSGQIEADFFGGKAALGNGINMDLLRLRIALGRLDWTNFSLIVGQDWSIFAPLNPTSLASSAIPSMSASGNPWIRQPQIRLEARHALNDTSKFVWQIAATDPDVGDYSTTQFLTSRSPGIGERGRMPGIDSRLALTEVADDRDFTFGVSGHYNRGKNAGSIGTHNLANGVDSWGVAGDWSLPFTKYFNITGEAYSGRTLGIFSVASGESVTPVGTVGARGVLSRGGWIQAQFNFDRQWQANLDYGIDATRASELPVGNRNRNQTYMGNIMYKFSRYVTFALEYRRFLTDFRNQLLADERGDHVNLAIAYSF